jgi:DNA mismatch repair protein MutS2
MDAFTLEKIEFDNIRVLLGGFCATSLGKSLAGDIAPSDSAETIGVWLEQTSQMVQAVRDAGRLPFAGVCDITDAVGRAEPGGGAGGEDYAMIASALKGAACLGEHLQTLPEELDAIAALAAGIEDFQREADAIERVVAPDGSIRDDASDKLKSIRRETDATARSIADVMQTYVRRPDVAKLLQSTNVTVHGDRYVLAVKAENRGRVKGVVHRASNTGATVFVEPSASVELNNQLACLADDERKEIQRLLGELAFLIVAKADRILSTMSTIALVDLISAKAQYSLKYNMICPEVSAGGALEIHHARHPLLVDQAPAGSGSMGPQRQLEAVVPTDIRLGSDFDLLVITGSNTGGKTVTLKTVALMAVMAQCGMHIPARRGATIPVMADVLIDIGDEQSLEQSLSTFGAHIKRIRYILENARKGTLVLLDELGSGTDPDEGGAIGQAILDQLSDSGALVMASTHLSVLKAYAYNRDRVDNASVEFDVATLSPTYELRIGTPGESHAISVAQHLGLPEKVVAAARKYFDSRGHQFRKAIQATGAARQQAEAARSEAQTAHAEALNRKDDYEERIADMRGLKQEFLTWLATIDEMKPGDQIFIPSLKRKCKLVRMETHRQVVLVEAGHMQMEVPISDLMPDLGQDDLRKEVDELHAQLAAQGEQVKRETQLAQDTRRKCDLKLRELKEARDQFDRWSRQVANVKIGEKISIARKPGSGVLESLDLAGGRAVVKIPAGPVELTLEELFPQKGPFVAKSVAPKKKSGSKPIRRRQAGSKKAKASRKSVLSTAPGDKVYVVPFGKRATLIRFILEKDLAVVQSGAFEMQLPIADLEPVGYK